MRGLVIIAFAASACRWGFDAPRTADAPTDPSVDSAIDAAIGPCEPIACSNAKGTCTAGTCVIAATAEDFVRCPDGMPCRIECTGTGRPCRDGAACGAATSCEVRCLGYRACQAGVDCGTAETCAVTCDGEEACEDGISSGTGTCTAHCCGLEACVLGVGTCAVDAVCS